MFLEGGEQIQLENNFCGGIAFFYLNGSCVPDRELNINSIISIEPIILKHKNILIIMIFEF